MRAVLHHGTTAIFADPHEIANVFGCGVGNIYTPTRPCSGPASARYAVLVEAVRAVLGEAIVAGGTTLRDFPDPGGRPGYFSGHLAVYGRAGACAAARPSGWYAPASAAPTSARAASADRRQPVRGTPDGRCYAGDR